MGLCRGRSKSYIAIAIAIAILGPWTTGKRFEINPPFFHCLVLGQNMPSNDVSGDGVFHKFGQLFERQRFESRPFG